MGAPSQRVSELAKFWVKQGHSVSIITAMPNHPDGIVHTKYRWEYFKEEWFDGVRILRVFLYVTPNKGVLKRIFSFISFTITSLFVGLFMNKPDIVIATSPQLFVGISGLFIAKLKKIPFVFEIRDIWPQSAVELKMIRSHLVIRLMEKLERFLYYKADRVVVVVKNFTEQLAKKHVNKEKIVFVPNGIDKTRFENKTNKEIIGRYFDRKNKFVIGYFGTMGLAHGLDIVVKAAEHYRKTNVFFVLVGDGAEKEKIKRHAAARKIENLLVLEKIPAGEIPYAINEIDAGLIHLKKLPIFTEALPSKMFEYMAMGKPLLAGVSGSAKELLETNNAGVVFQPENLQEFINAIEKLRNSNEFCRKMGENGKKMVESEFDREILSQKYAKMMSVLIR